MKETYKIYVFRHGQTTYNRDKRFTGLKDAKLTSLGIKQARVIAKKLKNKKIEAAFYTRLSRSQDTLKEVLKYHPECTKQIKDDRMIERSYGDLEGVYHKTFIEKIGRKEYSLLKEGDALENLEGEDRKKIREFLGKNEFDIIHRGYNIAPPHGESFSDVEKRVGSFIKDLFKFMKKNNIHHVAISASGNSIRLFRKIMEKSSIKDSVKWFIPYDRVFEYNIRI